MHIILMIIMFVWNSLTIKVDYGAKKVSWYGGRFHGRKTANGEIYNKWEFTAAHKYLPFNTLLKVTNPTNNQSVIVRINDRGPYIKGRWLDISKAAAEKIEIIKQGVKTLQIEEIEFGVGF